MEYNFFYTHNIGYEYHDTNGKPVGKAALFNKYTPNWPSVDEQQEEQLTMLIAGTHPEYNRAEKPNFKDGQYVGLLEGSSAGRIYKLCPEAQVRKKREPNFKD